jgi:hypothetical protein
MPVAPRFTNGRLDLLSSSVFALVGVLTCAVSAKPPFRPLVVSGSEVCSVRWYLLPEVSTASDLLENDAVASMISSAPAPNATPSSVSR